MKTIKFLLTACAMIAIFLVFHFVAAAAGAAVLATFPFAISPQQKTMEVAKKFNLRRLKENQGTSRTIYDTLEILAGQEYYRFFEECNLRAFPFSNIGSNGNKLMPGESLSILWGYLNIFTITVEEGHDIKYTVDNMITYPKILLGEFSFLLGNSQVIKPIRLLEWGDQFNKNAKHQYNEVYHFNTIIEIIPMIDFIAPVRIIPFVAGDLKATHTYMQLTLEGTGSIFAPKDTF